MKRQVNEPEHKDPVCGMRVSRTAAAAEFEFEGKTYYFCAEACKLEFVTEPARFIRLHRQHGMKPRTTKRF